MNNRNYNIYFNTHTISGIIISAILYVIFFAGSFAFFKSEITSWQQNTSAAEISKKDINFNTIVDSLNKEYNLYGRDIYFYMYPRGGAKIGVSVSMSKDSSNKKRGGYFLYNSKTKVQSNYKESYDLGEFLYRLHFLAQVNGIARLGFPIGYYIAGGVAFAFLFALITGLLLHWNKIISNFYLFRPWEKLKTVWTDLHTALGVISFPFLFIFAVTGTYFLVSFPLMSKPTIAMQFDGKKEAFDKTMGYDDKNVPMAGKAIGKEIDINHFVSETFEKWDLTQLSYMQISNYGDQSMQVSMDVVLPRSEKFVGTGKIVYEAATGKVLEVKSPFEKAGYNGVVKDLVYTLHFGNYGGYATKVLYFLLGICGCVVIISGVLIWLVARNKKNIPGRKRKFNDWLANIYLSICLSMFPVTAASFIAVKIHPGGGTAFIYPFFFWSWLALSVLFIIRRNNYKTNRDSMLMGAIIGFFIPVANGVVSGNWIWTTYKKGFYDILLIDVFWLFVSMGAFICWYLIVKKYQKTNNTKIENSNKIEQEKELKKFRIS